MNIEGSNEKKIVQNPQGVIRPQHVLFAKSPSGATFGMVTDSEPSSLALLAAGVAGIAARRARRSERMKSLESHKTET
jgi:MYXO-CTERM domain-containing protein